MFAEAGINSPTASQAVASVLTADSAWLVSVRMRKELATLTAVHVSPSECSEISTNSGPQIVLNNSECQI